MLMNWCWCDFCKKKNKNHFGPDQTVWRANLILTILVAIRISWARVGIKL